VDKTVSVYGLGIGDTGRDRQALRRFERLAEWLTNPGRWLPADVEVSSYEPERYRGVFVEEDPEGSDLQRWPWTDLMPSDLRKFPAAAAISQADLTADQVSLVASVPNGGASGIGIASPDGQAAWRLSLRPLLPDDASLPAVEPTAPVTPSPAPEDPTHDDYAYEDSA
jgi:hypothetical protein